MVKEATRAHFMSAVQVAAVGNVECNVFERVAALTSLLDTGVVELQCRSESAQALPTRCGNRPECRVDPFPLGQHVVNCQLRAHKPE